MTKIEEVFRGLGRTEKAKFISQNIDYANADAVAKYTSAYLFVVLNTNKKWKILILKQK